MNTDKEVLERAISKYGFFSFGGTCTFGCKFCSFNAERRVSSLIEKSSIDFQVMRRTIPQLDRESLLHYVEYFSRCNLDKIFLSCAFCDEEPYLNPYFFEVLDYLEEHFPNILKFLVISAKSITKEICYKLTKYKILLFPSIMTFDLKKKNNLLYKETDNTNLIDFLSICAEQIQSAWFFWQNDFSILKNDIEYLRSLHDSYKSKPIDIRCIEYTKYSDSSMIPFYDDCHKSYNQAIIDSRSINHVSATIRKIPLDWNDSKYKHFYDESVQNFEKLLNKTNDADLISVSESVSDYAISTHPELSWSVAKNMFYGGSICTSKLLTVSDIVSSLPNSFDRSKKLAVALYLDQENRDFMGESFEDYGINNYQNLFGDYKSLIYYIME